MRRRLAVALAMCASLLAAPVLIGAGHAQGRVSVTAGAARPPSRVQVAEASRSGSFRVLDAEQIAAIADAPGPAEASAAAATVATVPSAALVRAVHRAASTTTTTTRPRPATTTTTAPTTTTTAAPAHSETGGASWYSGPDGQCANNTIPFGTVVTVTNLANGATTHCTVESRGPYEGGRIIDLTESTFSQIASPSQGVIQVRIQW